MTEHVDPGLIEDIVGMPRQPSAHYGKAVSEEGRFYILHSAACMQARSDLRECPFSVALDVGFTDEDWVYDWLGLEDMPIHLGINHEGRLVPHSKM